MSRIETFQQLGESMSNDPQRIARQYVLTGRQIPIAVQVQLEARGIDVGELEHRLRQNAEFVL